MINQNMKITQFLGISLWMSHNENINTESDTSHYWTEESKFYLNYFSQSASQLQPNRQHITAETNFKILHINNRQNEKKYGHAAQYKKDFWLQN